MLKCTAGLFCRFNYALHAKNAKLLKEIKPPYLLLPNHANLFDPFFLTWFMPYPLFFITGDSLFRNRFISYWIRHYGAIPKSRAISDMETIRHIINVIKAGSPLCIYPEAEQTWDGASLPIAEGTGKLVKFLKLPVIQVKTMGSFSMRPRWAPNKRKGRVSMEFSLMLTAEQVKSMSAEEIQKLVEEKNEYNEWDWMKKTRRQYNNTSGGCRSMEKAIYTCPSCKTMGKMKGIFNFIYCKECGYRVRYSNYGTFVSKKFPVYFSDMHKWNVWQTKELKNLIDKKVKDANGKPIFIMENRAKVSTGYRVNPMKKYGSGYVRLYTDRVEFDVDNDRRPPIIFKFSEIQGISFMRAYFEFYSEHTLYRFKFLTQRASSLKWVTAIRHLCETTTNQSQI